MQPNVPVPTDNLYKFQALFGLTLIISSLLGTVWLVQSSNDQIYEAAKEVASIDPASSPAAKDYAKAMAIKAKLAAKDRDGLVWFLFLAGGVGMIATVTGFAKWAKIQPLHDELLELQVAKARMEVHRSNVYRELPERPKPKKPASKTK